MASFDYNPITGQLDLVGSGGGSYIDGDVEYHSNLPVTVGTPAVNSAFLVRKGEGLYFISRKPAGIWVRELNNGNLDDWKYAGTFSDLYRDANFRIINDADTSKELAFQLSGISTGTTRTITVPDKNITLDDAGDSRTPSSHASSHAAAGSDPLAPSDIGAQSLFASGAITGASSPAAARAIIYDVMNFGSAYDITLPITNSLQGDIFVLRAVNFMAASVTIKYQVPPSGPQTVGTLTAVGEQLRFVYRANAQQWDLVPVDTHTHAAAAITSGTLDIARIPTGTSSSTVCIGNDARLSDARTPTSHTHGNLTNDGKIGSTAGLPLKTGTAGIVEAGVFGTGADEFAEGNHTHADLHTRSHAITSTSDHTAGNHKVFYSNGSGEIVELALGNSGEVLTSNGATSAPSFAAASGGIGGGTGSVDNAIIRADGTGGSTSQSSDLVIDDATTSTENNVTISNQHSGQTDSSIVIQPKGTGAFILGPKPDGAATVGGNARGDGAIDLQMERNGATAVASGNYAFAAGRRNTASSDTSVAIGFNNVASTGNYAVAIGRNNTASANSACCIGGQFNTASGSESAALSGNTNTASAVFAVTLGGNYSLADRGGMIAQCNGRFAATGDAQWIHMVLRAKTTTNSAVELLINSDRTTNGRLTCPSGKVISGIINIHGVKSDGTASAHYVRQFQVKNVGGTSSYPYTAATVGTDYASSTSITFNDPDTNGDALSVSVTGIASETWRWTAHVSAVETTYGS